MKTLITLILALCCLTVSAQRSLDPAPPQPVVEAGIHIEKAGKQRTTATLIQIGATVLGGGLLIAADGDKNGQTGALVLLGTGLTIGTVIHFGANAHEKRAGRIMQGF